MTTADKLKLLRLLSAIESAMLMTKESLPDYLHDDLDNTIAQLIDEILEEPK